MKPKIAGLVIVLVLAVAFGVIYLGQQGALSYIPNTSSTAQTSQPYQTECIGGAPIDGSPLAPTNISIAKVTSNQINLYWSDRSTNEDGFIVESQAPTGEWVEVSPRLPINTTTFQHLNLQPSTLYSYRVKSYNMCDTTLFSSPTVVVMSTTTLEHVIIPAASTPVVTQPLPATPSGFTARASTSQVDLSWNYNNDNTADGFVIDRSTDNNAWYKLAQLGKSERNFSNTTVSPGTTYYYRIRAFNSFGNSVPDTSLNVSVTVPAAIAADTTPPVLRAISPNSNAVIDASKEATAKFTFSVSATDNVGIANVYLYMDCDNTSFLVPASSQYGVCGNKGVLLASFGGNEYSGSPGTFGVRIDTRSLTNGTHKTFAKAVDTSGNVTTIDPSFVVVGAPYNPLKAEPQKIGPSGIAAYTAPPVVLPVSAAPTTARAATTAGSPTVRVGESVSFSASTAALSTLGRVTNVLWNFGDSIANVASTGVTPPNYTITHTYAAPATYNATFIVTYVTFEGVRSSAQGTVPVTVLAAANQPPVITSFTASPSSATLGADGFDITFAATAHDPDGILQNLAWDFGDGASINSSNSLQVHRYTTARTFQPTLVATDNLGLSSIQRTIAGGVSIAPLQTRIDCATPPDTTVPTVNFINPNSVIRGESPLPGSNISGNTKLTIAATDGRCLNKVVFYINVGRDWRFVNQTEVLSTGSISDTFATTSLTFDTTHFQNGPHSILVMVYDMSGNSASDQLSINVTNTLSDPGDSQWLNETGRSLLNGEIVNTAVKTDSQGNTIVVGDFKGTVTFGTILKTALGGQDAFVAKYSPTGNLLWVRTYGGSDPDHATAVAIDSQNNILVTGYFFGRANFGGADMTSLDGIYGSDIYVAKYTADGTHIWSKQIGGLFGNNSSASIAVDQDNDVIVGGNFYTEADLGGGIDYSHPVHRVRTIAGSNDAFISKFNGTDGGFIWSKSFGGAASDYVKGIAVDTGGNVVVVGYGYDVMDFGAGNMPYSGNSDLYIAKYAGADGHYLWAKTAGGSLPDAAEGVAVDRDNNIFITGGYYNTLDLGGISITPRFDTGIFVAKYIPTAGTSAYSLAWVKPISFETAGGSIGVRSIDVDSLGNAVITGNASGAVDFGNNVQTYGDVNFYVAKYGPTGTNLWSKRSANDGFIGGGYDVAVDRNRNIYAAGSIQGTVTLDGLQVSSPGALIKSGFLYKISP